MKKNYRRFSLHVAMMIALVASIFMPTVYSSFVMSNEGSDLTIDTPSATLVARNVTQGKSYYSVEKALYQAKSGDSVYIIPGSNPIIYNDVTIKSGVSLYLPYASDESTGTFTHYSIDDSAGHNHVQTQIQAYCNSANLKNSLTISEKVTLTNNGSLYVDGIISGGNGGKKLSSYTASDYTQILLDKDAKIENYGYVQCSGYIFEKDQNNGSRFNNNSSGKVYVPFSVIEHRGGSAFVEMAGGAVNIAINNIKLQTSPFNRYLLNNISAKFTAFYGSYVYGIADLYASEKNNVTTINLVGNSNSYLINLSNSNSKFVYKFYQKNYAGETQTYYAETGYYDIYGGFQLNSLSLTLTLYGVTRSLSTKSVYFPLTYLTNIRLHRGIDGSESSVVLNQDIRLLPGTYLKIDEGVNVTASKIIAYYNYVDSEGTTLDELVSNEHKYPTFDTTVDAFVVTQNTNMSVASVKVGEAKFIINGSLTISYLGGKVTTSNENATLIINSGVSIESKEVYQTTKNEGGNISTYVTYKTSSCSQAVGTIKDSGTGATSLSNFETTSYVSINENGVYAWEKASGFSKYVLALHPGFNSDGSIVSDASITLDPQTKLTNYVKQLPANIVTVASSPTRNGYIFEGWYTDSTCTTTKVGRDNIVASTDGEEITLYAKWVYEEYSITYKFVDKATKKEDMGSYVDSNSNPTTYTLLDSFTLSNPIVKEGYDFYGWYLVDMENNSYSSISGITEGTTGDLIIVGVVDIKEVSIKIIFGTNEYGLTEEKIAKNDWTGSVSSVSLDTINNDTEKQMYLENNGKTFYSDSSCKNEITIDAGKLTSDLKVYVKRVPKNYVEIKNLISYQSYSSKFVYYNPLDNKILSFKFNDYVSSIEGTQFYQLSYNNNSYEISSDTTFLSLINPSGSTFSGNHTFTSIYKYKVTFSNKSNYRMRINNVKNPSVDDWFLGSTKYSYKIDGTAGTYNTLKITGVWTNKPIFSIEQKLLKEQSGRFNMPEEPVNIVFGKF